MMKRDTSKSAIPGSKLPHHESFAAYIRKSPASLSMRAQWKDLESIAQQRQIQIVELIKDPGHCKAGDLQRNESLQRLLYRLYVDVDLIGVMFWHVGHIARDMDDFLKIANILEKIHEERRIEISWYIHSQELWREDLNQAHASYLFSFLEKLNKDIIDFSKKERKAAYKNEEIKNPGKPRIPEDTEKKIVIMRKKGMKIQEISDTVHVSKSTVHRVIKEHKL